MPPALLLSCRGPGVDYDDVPLAHDDTKDSVASTDASDNFK